MRTWLCDRSTLNPTISTRYVVTKEPMADILTQGSFAEVQWRPLLHWTQRQKKKNCNQLKHFPAAIIRSIAPWSLRHCLSEKRKPERCEVFKNAKGDLLPITTQNPWRQSCRHGQGALGRNSLSVGQSVEGMWMNMRQLCSTAGFNLGGTYDKFNEASKNV